jgi:O-antigen/teichoic acid export membrane protein
MTSRSLAHVTFRSLSWSAIGVALRSLSQLVVLIVLSRVLTQSEYGVATLLISIFNLFWAQFEAGIGMAVLQRPNLDDARIRVSFTMALCAGIVVPAVVALLADSLADFFSMPELPGPLYLLCLGMFLRSLTIVSEYLLHRDLDFRRLAIIETFSFGIGFGGVAIAGGLLGAGVWSIAAGQFAYCVLKSLFIGAQKTHTVRPLLSLPLLREMSYFACGFTLGSALATASHEIDKVLVGRFMTSAAVGVYGRAIQIFVMPTSLLGQVVDRVLFSVLASVKSDPARVQKCLKGGTAFFALSILPASVAAAALAPELVRVLLGPGWIEVVEPLQVLCIGMYLRTSVKVSEAIIRAQGAVYRRLSYYALSACLVAVGTAIGYRWGLAGVALGNVIATTVFFAAMTRLSLRFADLSIGTYLGLHVPGMILAAVVGAEALILLPLLRGEFESSWGVLLAGGAVSSGSVLVLCLALPSLFLGSEGRWLVERISGFLGVRQA